MVTCPVCGTAFAANRPDCPCCGRSAPPPPAAPPAPGSGPLKTPPALPVPPPAVVAAGQNPTSEQLLGTLPTLHAPPGTLPKVALPGWFARLFPAAVRPFLPSFSRWDFAALGGGGVGAALWHYWAKMSVPDPVTPKIILALPLLFIFLRKPIDLLLAPLEIVKSRIPRLFLIGAGLATPYLVTNYFYNKLHISNYPLAQYSILWGTLLSYVIMRIPEVEGLPKLSSLFKGRSAAWLAWFGIGAVWLTVTDLALADDFTRDWRRLEDGMRTPGWAQAIAGTTATVINGLVNGALIFQTTTRRPRGPEEPEDNTHYTLDVRTEGERTTLAADGDDRIWVYGQLSCDKPAVDCAALTRALSFTFGGAQAGWMSIKSEQFTDGFKAVQLVATPPTPETEVPPDATVVVTVSGRTADGDQVQVPVNLRLEEGLKMEVEILS